MSALSLTPVKNSLVVELIAPTPQRFSNEVNKRVNEIWERARLDNPRLFDGTNLCVDTMRSGHIECFQVRYKYLFAQHRSPELAAELRLKPLAVSGVTVIGDKILFGTRSKKVTQSQSMLELLPSGGMDAPSELGPVDYKKQLLTELREETEIESGAVQSIDPICVIDDDEENVVDIAAFIRLRHTDERAILEDFKAGEYTEIAAMHLPELKDSVRREPDRWVRASVALIEYLKLIPEAK